MTPESVRRYDSNPINPFWTSLSFCQNLRTYIEDGTRRCTKYIGLPKIIGLDADAMSGIDGQIAHGLPIKNGTSPPSVKPFRKLTRLCPCLSSNPSSARNELSLR